MSFTEIHNLESLLAEVNSSGKALPKWLEDALRKAQYDKQQKEAVERKQISEEAAKMQEQEKPYQERIDRLIGDFFKNLPDDYKKYQSNEVKTTVKDSTQKIRQLANDIDKLSELAGNNPELKEKGVAITKNLLGRLQAALNLSEQDRKHLESLKPEEQLREYAKLVKEPTAEVLQVIERSQAKVTGLIEGHQALVSSGKSKVDIVNLYDETLNKIAKDTDNKEVTFKNRIKIYEAYLDELKPQSKDSTRISKGRLEQLQREKNAADIEL